MVVGVAICSTHEILQSSLNRYMHMHVFVSYVVARSDSELVHLTWRKGESKMIVRSTRSATSPSPQN